MDLGILWDQIINYVLGPEFLLMALFVIAVMEVIKTHCKGFIHKFAGDKWSSTIHPWIAGILSCIAVFLANLGDLPNVETWLLLGITQAALVDLFYSWFGKPAIRTVKFAWGKMLNAYMHKKTDVKNEKK